MVDEVLKVYGTTDVRVIDAGVVSVPFSAHRMTLTCAIAVKGVGFVLGVNASSGGVNGSNGGNTSDTSNSNSNSTLSTLCNTSGTRL